MSRHHLPLYSSATVLSSQSPQIFLFRGDQALMEGSRVIASLAESASEPAVSCSELSPAQRAAAISRRKELWEVLHPEETRRNPAGLGGCGNVGFAGDVERVTGDDQRRTREHLARAASLGTDLHAVIGTSLDKGVELAGQIGF